MRGAGKGWPGAWLGLALWACSGEPEPGDGLASAAPPVAAGEAARDSLPIGGNTVEPEPAPGPSEPPLPEPPRWPQPPPGYGVLALAAPSAEQLELYAVAGYEVVAVHAQPDPESRKLGFLRLGQRLRATAPTGEVGCPKGWHGLEGGGYACASKGLVIDRRPPFMKHEPPAPRLDSPFPYEWAYVRHFNTPMWWRTPTEDEIVRMKEERAQLEAQRLAAPADGETGLPAASATTSAGAPVEAAPAPPAEPTDALPAVDEEPRPVPIEAPAPDPAAPPVDPAVVAPPAALPLSPTHPWLEKGYFISIAGRVAEGGRSYWHTARGGFVPQAETYRYEPKDFRGVELGEDITFPLGFARKSETKVYELDPQDRLRLVEKVDRRSFFDFDEEVEHGGKTYLRTPEGKLLRKDDVVMPDLQARPKGLEEWDRWIDVSLAQQMLVAYEGARPVYVTLVSTGKKGSAEETFSTPTGRFRIVSKQVTSNMDGTTATDGNYAIQDVPWVLYFEGSYALHGAFWHRAFGSVRSHGCVNLGPSDARWLFHWTTPVLPAGWHGVHATDDAPGTTVIIRE